MDQKTLFDRVLRYFKPYELVGPQAYAQFKHRWDYFFLSRIDPRLLHNLLWIREKLGRKITVNDWFWGGRFSQRGLRDNLMPIVQDKNVVYLSAHVVAMGIDFDVEGMTATEVRQWLQDHADELPYKIRLERKLFGKEISWVHMDTVDDPRLPKVYLFDVA